MDEEKKELIETAEAPEPAEIPAPLPLTWQEVVIPFLALAVALVYWQSFDLECMAYNGLPGLGILALVVAHFTAVFIVLGKRVHLTVESIFCTAAALVLGLYCALYTLYPFLILNCFIILAVAAMATFSLSGHTAHLRSQTDKLLGSVSLTFRALFSRLGRPFRTAGRIFKGDKNSMGQAALAIVAAIPVLAVVLWLLSSADQVFGSLLDFHVAINGRAVYSAFRALFLAAFIASALYFIREDFTPADAKEAVEKERHVLPFLLVTVLLDGVYALFCAIQVKYLFGGAAAAAMAGGWAEYARTGFFQLVAVAAINLGLCLLGTDAKRFAAKAGKTLRVAFAILLALTSVILVSAFWRMRLYILAYGMSVLRLMTLWGMAVIAVGILAAAWKLFHTGFDFLRVAGGFALGLWCVMCLANPAGMIASYNVDHYVSGELPELDVYYLSDLGPDILPALPPLQELGEEGQEEFDRIFRLMSYYALEDDAPWSFWHLSSWRAWR